MSTVPAEPDIEVVNYGPWRNRSDGGRVGGDRCFCIIALGSLCEITNWSERRRLACHDPLEHKVQKSPAGRSDSNDGMTQFIQHAQLGESGPGIFQVVGTVNLDALTIAPQLAVIDRITRRPSGLVTLCATPDPLARDVRIAGKNRPAANAARELNSTESGPLTVGGSDSAFSQPAM
jgi:hypothetical protein